MGIKFGEILDEEQDTYRCTTPMTLQGLRNLEPQSNCKQIRDNHKVKGILFLFLN